jgi:hypothetical protein
VCIVCWSNERTVVCVGVFLFVGLDTALCRSCPGTKKNGPT